MGAPLLWVPTSCTIVYLVLSHAPALLLVAWKTIQVWVVSGLRKKPVLPVPKLSLALEKTHPELLVQAEALVGFVMPSHVSCPR